MITTTNTPVAEVSASCAATVCCPHHAPEAGSVLDRILIQCGFETMGRQTLAGREGAFVPVPLKLRTKIRTCLETTLPNGLYSHQAQAIEHSLDGADVCLSTSTASGKSLVFMATAAHELLSDDNARVLVLYPARALIQDQLAKWNKLLAPLSLEAGFIDGSVPMAERKEILFRRRVVLMTPDVAQAWFMSNLNEKAVAAFRSNLKLLILDEAQFHHCQQDDLRSKLLPTHRPEPATLVRLRQGRCYHEPPQL